MTRQTTLFRLSSVLALTALIHCGLISNPVWAQTLTNATRSTSLKPRTARLRLHPSATAATNSIPNLSRTAPVFVPALNRSRLGRLSTPTQSTIPIAPRPKTPTPRTSPARQQNPFRQMGPWVAPVVPRSVPRVIRQFKPSNGPSSYSRSPRSNASSNGYPPVPTVRHAADLGRIPSRPRQLQPNLIELIGGRIPDPTQRNPHSQIAHMVPSMRPDRLTAPSDFDPFTRQPGSRIVPASSLGQNSGGNSSTNPAGIAAADLLQPFGGGRAGTGHDPSRTPEVHRQPAGFTTPGTVESTDVTPQVAQLPPGWIDPYVSDTNVEEGGSGGDNNVDPDEPNYTGPKPAGKTTEPADPDYEELEMTHLGAPTKTENETTFVHEDRGEFWSKTKQDDGGYLIQRLKRNGERTTAWFDRHGNPLVGGTRYGGPKDRTPRPDGSLDPERAAEIRDWVNHVTGRGQGAYPHLTDAPVQNAFRSIAQPATPEADDSQVNPGHPDSETGQKGPTDQRPREMLSGDTPVGPIRHNHPDGN